MVSVSALDKVIYPHLVAKKDSNPIHKLFSYPAKFQGYLPEAVIRNFTKPGDVVLDPYSGGGTTAVAAMLNGRNSISYDLNPISVLSATAKTTILSTNEVQFCIANLQYIKPTKKKVMLTDKESMLMGTRLSQMAESVWELAIEEKTGRAKYLLGIILSKRIKMACRRDKTHIREYEFEKHIKYIGDEVKKFFSSIKNKNKDITQDVKFGSNHDMDVPKTDIIITSPPYPNVDVEYNLIQIQRSDMNTCYRSNVTERIAESILGISSKANKKQLCNGGTYGGYWDNLEKSLIEMKRVNKKDGLCFLYVGFKSYSDKNKYENLMEKCGFDVIRKYDVLLGEERIASSRSLYHGKDTKMMKRDYLYVGLS